MITKVFLTIAGILFICALISAGMVILDWKRENVWTKITTITLILGAIILIGGGFLTLVWTE